jgi:hypothetical protein
MRTRMHGKRGNRSKRCKVKMASNNPGNLEANSDTCRFPILFQMRPRKDGIIIFRTLGPTLQGLCGWFKGRISRHPCRDPCGNGEHTTGNRVCLEQWRHTVDIMLEKITGIAWWNKLRIIQLLEADLNQVLRAAFARNVTKLAQNHKGVISEHQYGRSHRTCISPILNKLLTIQILIKKRTNGIFFNNDAKGCSR